MKTFIPFKWQEFVEKKLSGKRLTRELQEVGFVAEDQVVVGDKVEEPDVQLLRVVALRKKAERKKNHSNRDRSRGPASHRFGLTLARRRRRITLMPVDASSRLGML